MPIFKIYWVNLIYFKNNSKIFNLLFQKDCLTDEIFATYAPPEYHLRNRCYPNGAEMWALGGMLYHFVTGNLFEETTNQKSERITKLQRQVLLKKLDGVFSIKVQRLLRCLLGWSEKRIRIDQVLRSDWVVNGPTTKK